MDLFLNSKFVSFYCQEHKPKQDSICDMLEGNINRMCICDDKEELYIRFFSAVGNLQELCQLQCKKFDRVKKFTDESSEETKKEN